MNTILFFFNVNVAFYTSSILNFRNVCVGDRYMYNICINNYYKHIKQAVKLDIVKFNTKLIAMNTYMTQK